MLVSAAVHSMRCLASSNKLDTMFGSVDFLAEDDIRPNVAASPPKRRGSESRKKRSRSFSRFSLSMQQSYPVHVTLSGAKSLICRVRDASLRRVTNARFAQHDITLLFNQLSNIQTFQRFNSRRKHRHLNLPLRQLHHFNRFLRRNRRRFEELTCHAAESCA